MNREELETLLAEYFHIFDDVAAIDESIQSTKATLELLECGYEHLGTVGTSNDHYHEHQSPLYEGQSLSDTVAMYQNAIKKHKKRLQNEELERANVIAGFEYVDEFYHNITDEEKNILQYMLAFCGSGITVGEMLRMSAEEVNLIYEQLLSSLNERVEHKEEKTGFLGERNRFFGRNIEFKV